MQRSLDQGAHCGNVQEEAKQANDAAHHAQGAAFAAQQDLAHERTRAQELQVRCLQAEEQCAKMVMQIQSLHAKADSQDAELTQWQQHSLGPSDRDKIIEMIGKLFTRWATCYLNMLVVMLGHVSGEMSYLHTMPDVRNSCGVQYSPFMHCTGLPGALIDDGCEIKFLPNVQ